MPALGIVDGAMNSVHVSALLALDRGALKSATANHGCRWVLVVDDCILYCLMLFRERSTPFSLSLFFVSTSANNPDGDADREKIYQDLPLALSSYRTPTPRLQRSETLLEISFDKEGWGGSGDGIGWDRMGWNERGLRLGGLGDGRCGDQWRSGPLDLASE